MREGIHPNYIVTTISCACGYSLQTRSTKDKVHVEICSNCHPFFTGKQKLVDAAGRMERFSKRFEKTAGKTVRLKAKEKAAVVIPVGRKILTTTPVKAKPIDKKAAKKIAAAAAAPKAAPKKDSAPPKTN